MNPVDIVILVVSIPALGGILFYFGYLKHKGQSIHCNCGKKHLSGKKLVDEYHESNCCCQKHDD